MRFAWAATTTLITHCTVKQVLLCWVLELQSKTRDWQSMSAIIPSYRTIYRNHALALHHGFAKANLWNKIHATTYMYTELTQNIQVLHTTSTMHVTPRKQHVPWCKATLMFDSASCTPHGSQQLHQHGVVTHTDPATSSIDQLVSAVLVILLCNLIIYH